MRTRINATFLAAVVGVSVAATATRDAAACGGTFCDSGPTAMPVDQKGENILFVLDGKTVEAHVQIQYQGSASRFAWVVPMPKVPEVEVGSQPLFDAMLAASVPTFGFSQTSDQCGGSGGVAGSSFLNGDASSGAGAGGSSGSGGGGPAVVLQEVVGAFEVTVLSGGTAVEVSKWLDDNGYQSIKTAPAKLDHYVQKNFVFVALKLTGAAGVDQIHPLVFRYQGDEPCVPLVLTAVAAVENMGVRAFFLGDDRIVPVNYKHVELNPARIDWSSFGSNYDQVVARAADSPVADGHAFATEYAGPSAAAKNFMIYSADWDAAPFATVEPVDVMATLEIQGLAACYGYGYCNFYHPLLLALLRQYLPAPAQLDEGEFYDCLSCYADQIDTSKWDGAAFAQDFDARIVKPARHADGLLDRWPYLTRLYTELSPAEMTEDPIFGARTDLPQVTPLAMGSERTMCDGRRVMTLPDARIVSETEFNGWPLFSSRMPWAEKIQEFPVGGEPITLVDNSQLIDDELAAWNASQWPAGLPPAGAGGAWSASGLETQTEPAGGCACSVPLASRGAGAALLAALGIVTVARRRSASRRTR